MSFLRSACVAVVVVFSGCDERSASTGEPGGALSACLGPLAKSGCAPTFDEQDRREGYRGACVGQGCCSRAGVRGSHKVWQMPLGPAPLGGLVCVYDETGTRLVASHGCTDSGHDQCPNHEFCFDAGIRYTDLELGDLSTLPLHCLFDEVRSQAEFCAATLDDVHDNCASTFAEQDGRPVACGPASHISVAACGKARVWSRSTNAAFVGEEECIYGTDGRLVTATICSDVSCGKTCLHAGAVSSSVYECTFTETPARLCP